MAIQTETVDPLPLYFARSTMTTEANNTGTWRFMRPVYQEKTAPCSVGCPAAEDIPRIEMAAAAGDIRQAWNTIMMENPFPCICGRVCFHPCEAACNRREYDEPVAIHHLERYIGDTAIKAGMKPEFKGCADNGKRIAIAGSGPAGLSAAWFLRRLGYGCDIFESKSHPGGLLRWGIPSYRLPMEVLDQEINRVIDTGVRIFCNTPVTEAFVHRPDSEYHGMFLAWGYDEPVKMNISGEEYVCDGLADLERFKNDSGACTVNTAAVIGGGNTAIDLARSLMRNGVRTTIYYRRRIEDMPAFRHEVDMALKEGVVIRQLMAPVSVTETNNGYDVIFRKMKPADMSPGKRTRVVPDSEKTEKISAGRVFRATGAQPGKNRRFDAGAEGHILRLSHCAYTQSRVPVIYGGDPAIPVNSVTDAIASGKQAAMVMDICFRHGKTAIEDRLEASRISAGGPLSMEIYIDGIRKDRNTHVVSFPEINTDYFRKKERQEPLSLPPAQSVTSFDEVRAAFTPEVFSKEVRRCFNCGVCNGCDNCLTFCPDLAVRVSPVRSIDLKYCKGCGICVVECPRSAMILKEETA